MEPDRYKKNHALFFVAMISLLFSLGLLFFSAYLFPYLVLGWVYHVPQFIFDWHEWFITDFGVSAIKVPRLIFLIFLTPALLFGVVAYFSSNQIENHIFEKEISEQQKPTRVFRGRKESLRFFLKILALLGLVFVVVAIGLQWILSISYPSV